MAHASLRQADDGAWRVYATDSYKLVAIDVEAGDEDTAGALPVDAIKASRKHGGVLSVNEACVTGGVSYPRPDVEQSLDYEQLLGGAPVEGADGTVTFGINAKLLHELAQAMGEDTLRVTVNTESPGKPMRVRRLDGSEAVRGLLMPVRIR